MPIATLAIAGSVSLVAGVAFFAVARSVLSREATGERVLARRAHVAWWGGLGTYLVLQGAFTVMGAFGALTSEVYLASRVVAIPLLCIATWGITFYLLFLYTGDRRHARWTAALYGAVALLFFYVTFSTPQRLVVEGWIVALDDSHPLFAVVYALVGLPPIVASVGYFLLLRRTSDPAQRYRIKLVAGSILLYVGSGLAARLAASDAIIFVTLVLFGIAAAAGSLFAYYPPAALRRRFAEGRA